MRIPLFTEPLVLAYSSLHHFIKDDKERVRWGGGVGEGERERERDVKREE